MKRKNTQDYKQLTEMSNILYKLTKLCCECCARVRLKCAVSVLFEKLMRGRLKCSVSVAESVGNT